MFELKNQNCPFCGVKKLTLIEKEMEVPYFGKCYLMAMYCNNCKYHKSDVESYETKTPIRYTFTIENEKDLNVRVVKSSNAIVKVTQLKITMEPSSASIGFITNVEGLLARFKSILEQLRDELEDNKAKKKIKNLIKKLQNVELGEEKLKIIIEDKTGNSAIISEKSEVKKIK